MVLASIVDTMSVPAVCRRGLYRVEEAEIQKGNGGLWRTLAIWL